MGLKSAITALLSQGAATVIVVVLLVLSVSAATAILATDAPRPTFLGGAPVDDLPAGTIETSGPIAIAVDGDITPGATVTVTATLDGEAVSGADVYVKDGTGERQLVGQTDSDGRLDVTVPSEGEKAGELNVKVRSGELEGEFEFEPAEADEAEGAIDIDIIGEITPGATVTVVATHDGEAVSGADVYVKDGNNERQLVGQTDADGRLDVTVPSEGEKAGELNVKVRMGELEGEFESDGANED